MSTRTPLEAARRHSRAALWRLAWVAAAFFATIAFVLSKFGYQPQTLAHARLLNFILATFCAFAVLTAFCVVSLLRIHRTFMAIRAALPQAQFDQWQQAVIANPVSPETPLQQMRDSVRRLSAVPRILVAVRHRAAMLANALDYAHESPGNALGFIDNTHSAMLPSLPWRGLAQSCLTALLFIGIIGTFSGLLVVFQGQAVQKLFDDLAGGQPYTGEVGTLLDGFGLAFGASLVAYASYLGGRLMLEMADESYDLLIAFVDGDLRSLIRSVLVPLQVHLQVNFSPEERRRIDTLASSNAILAEQTAARATQLEELVGQVTDLGRQFAAGIATVHESARTIAQALEIGRQEWERAGKAWADQTQLFTQESERFAQSVVTYSESVDAVRSGFQQTAAEISAAWRAGVDETIQLFSERVRNIETIWADHTSAMTKRVTDQLLTYSQSIKESQTEIHGQLQAYGQMRDAVQSAAELVKDGQARLDQTLGALSREEDNARRQIVAALQLRMNDVDQWLASLARMSEDLRTDLAQMAQETAQLRATLLGNAQSGDLVGVLHRLERFLTMSHEGVV